MVVGTVAGLILNWSALLAALSGLAIIAAWLSLGAESWANSGLALGGLTALAVIIYGLSLKFDLARWPRIAISLIGALALCSMAIAVSEWGFAQFETAPYAIPIALAATFALVATPVVIRFLPVFRAEAYRRLLFAISLYAAGIIVPVLALLCFYGLRHLAGQHVEADAPWWSLLRYADGFVLLIAIAAVAGLFSFFILDVNLTGPHKLYRDQLSQTFIWPPETRYLALSNMNPSHRAPYHLINATVNLPSSRSPYFATERVTSFCFRSTGWGRRQSITSALLAGRRRAVQWIWQLQWRFLGLQHRRGWASGRFLHFRRS